MEIRKQDFIRILERINNLEAQITKLKQTSKPPIIKVLSPDQKERIQKIREEQKSRLKNYLEKQKRTAQYIKEKLEKRQPVRDLELLTVWASDTDSLILTPLDTVQTQGFGTQDMTTNTIGQVIPLQTLNFLFNSIISKVNELIPVINDLGSMAYQDSDNVSITGGDIYYTNVKYIGGFTPVADCYVSLGTSPTISTSTNIASVSHVSTGVYNFTFTNAINSSNYDARLTINEGSSSPKPNFVYSYVQNQTTTGFQLKVYVSQGAGIGSDNSLVLSDDGVGGNLYVVYLDPTSASL